MSKAFSIQSHQRSSFIKPYSLKSRNHFQGNINKSLIGQLPESVDLGERLKQKDMEIERLTHALQFYRSTEKNVQKSINPFDFYLNDDKKPTSNNLNTKLQQYLFDTQIKQLIQNAAKAHSLSIQNNQLKEEIRQLREEIISLQQVKKSGNSGSQKQINKKIKDSQIQVNKLRSQIWSLQAQINKMTYQNSQLKKALNSVTKIKLGQESQSVVKLIQQSSEFNKTNSVSSQGVQQKVLQLKQNLQTITTQCDYLKKKNTQLQAKLFQVTSQNQTTMRQRADTFSPKRTNPNRFSISSSNMKATIMNSISEIQMIDLERFQLKIAQKNKQYEQLYHKYQKIENEKIALQDMNEQLERERKFLADRLGEIQILQEGDEVVGEMENKLVLMSTELMRLGNLNRNKLKQTQSLSIQLKQTIHKLQITTKQNIQKQKIILNYKQQLTLLQQRIHQKSLLDNYDQETLEQYKEQLMEKDKEISRLKYLCKQLEEDIKTYELKVKVFEEKIQRLEQDNRELQKENKEMEKSLLAQSSVKHFNLQLEVQKYKTQCSTLQTEIKTIQSKLTLLRNQLHQSQSQRSSLVAQRHSYQQKLSQLQSRLKKYQFRVQEKQQQLRDLKHSYEEKLITKNEQIRKVTQKITIMERNAESIMKSPKKGIDQHTLENIHRMEQENMILKIQISKYEERVAKMTQEIQRLNFSLQKISAENGSISSLTVSNKQKQKQLRQYKRQVDSLNNKVRRLEEEKSFAQKRNNQMQGQLKRLQRFEGEYRKMKNQYEMTKSQLQIKEQQYVTLSKRLQSSSNSHIASPRSYLNEQTQQKILSYQKRISSLSSQYQKRYSSQISSLKRQLQSYKLKLQSLQHIADQDLLHEQLSEQIIRLNHVLGERVAEIVVLQKELQLYHHKVEKCEELLAQQRNSKIKQMGSFLSQNSIFQTQQNHTSLIKNQQKEIVLLTERLKTTKQNNRSLEEKVDQLISEKIKLQHKVSQLQYMRGERSMVYHQNESHLTNLISQIRISNERLEQSIKQIQQHYIERIQQKQAYTKRIQNQFRQQKASLQRQLYEIQSEYRRLQAQNREKQSLLMHNQQSSVLQQSQHQNYLKIKEEYQVKLVLLSQEIQRCKMLKDQKVEENEQLKRRVLSVEQEKKELIIQNESNKNTVEILSQEIVRLSDVLSSNIDEIRRGDKELAKLHLKIQELTSQNNSLKQLAKQPQSPRRQPYITQQQYQSLNHQYTQAKNNLLSAQQQINYLQQQVREQQNKIESQKRQHLEIQEQYNRIVREKRILTEDKDLMESKVRDLKRTQENLKELLNEQLKKKQQSQMELFQRRSQVSEYKFKEREENSLNLLREQIRTLKQSNNSLQSKFQLILTENQKLVSQVQGFKRSKSNSITSNKNNEQQVEQLNQLKSQNSLLKWEIHELQERILENNKFRGQVQGYQEQLNQYESRIKRVMSEKASVFEEVTKLQQQYKQKCQQVRKLSLRNNQLEDEIHSLRGKLQRTSQEVLSIKKEKKQLLQRMQTLHKTYQTNQQSLINNQNNAPNPNSSSRIKAEYYTKTIKMTSIDQVDEKQQRSRGPSAHQNKHNINQPISKELLQKYEILESINIKLKKENECYRKKSIEYEFKMNKLKEEFDLLSKLINEYREENDRLKRTMSSQAERGDYVVMGKNVVHGYDLTTNTKHTMGSNQTIQNAGYHINDQQKHQHSYSQTRIINSHAPQIIVNPNIASKPISPTTNLTTTKNGSSITFHGSAMNMNQYNDLKQSMHHIQTQLSQKNIENPMSVQGNTTMVTIPIQQIHMLINEIDRLLAENKSLAQELNDQKVMMIKHDSTTIVLMVVEIQALRHRVAVAQAERQQFRRQSFSPSKTNR